MALCCSPGCSIAAKHRCSVCKIFYCSRRCQESHWPSHWRDCLPVPDLEPIESSQTNTAKDIKKTRPADNSLSTKKSLSEGEEVEAFVSYFRTPSSGLYMLPSTNVEKLIEMIDTFSLEPEPRPSNNSATDPSPRVSTSLGNVCLAYDEQESCWYRAEITKYYESNDTVEVFLIDYGKTIRSPAFKLKQLPDKFRTIPGLVFEIYLRGVRPGTGNRWTKEELEDAHKVLDNQTLFSVKEMKIVNGKMFSRLVDSEGNDVSSLMVEIGCAGPDCLSGYTFKRNTLPPGTQTVIILNTVSAAEFYVCTEEQLESYTSVVIPFLAECAEDADYVLTAKEDDVVLAKYKQHWYRARVLKILANYQVRLLLLDVKTEKTLTFNELKKASQEIYKHPILSVKCCFKSWADYEDKSGKVTEKLKELLKKYEKIDVDVIESIDDKHVVKSKEVEDHLEVVKTSVELNSRFDVLKAKLKTKSYAYDYRKPYI